MGARPLSRVISEKIKTPLAQKILFDNIHDAIVEVDIDDEENITFNADNKKVSSKLPEEVVSKDGYIVLDNFKPDSNETIDR